jgi:hypothetical protein
MEISAGDETLMSPSTTFPMLAPIEDCLPPLPSLLPDGENSQPQELMQAKTVERTDKSVQPELGVDADERKEAAHECFPAMEVAAAADGGMSEGRVEQDGVREAEAVDSTATPRSVLTALREMARRKRGRSCINSDASTSCCVRLSFT